ACVASGVFCTIDLDRPPRGPKRGHLKELRARIETLERRISDHDGPFNIDDLVDLDFENAPTVADVDVGDVNGDAQMNVPLSSGNVTHNPPKSPTPPRPQPVVSLVAGNLHYPNQQPTLNLRTPESLGATSGAIPMLTGADMDQLYFDRVHVFIPLLQQNRYFSWARQPYQSGSHICLQYALWTMAACFSSHFQLLCGNLYRDTRQMLERLELEDGALDEAFQLQRAQAWILVAVYEILRTSFHRAWMSAGRAIRLVQVMKLHDLDSSSQPGDGSLVAPGTDTVDVEEKRRTFWMAYCLDRLFSALNTLPFSINENIISTRLPALEADFQQGSFVVMPFLSEALAEKEPTIMGPFTEIVIFCTIWGQILCHQQQNVLQPECEASIVKFWDHQIWLDNHLTRRIEQHQRINPKSPVWVDATLLFVNMVAQAAVLGLSKSTESNRWHVQGYEAVATRYQEKSFVAAQELASLSQDLSKLSFFKIHPFTSIPLLFCRDFITAQNNLDHVVDEDLLRIVEALQRLKEANLLCQAQLTVVTEGKTTIIESLLDWEEQDFHLSP
ncbi:hypothetical protein CDV55_100174, partial [Aspergillus turcosus]